MEYTAHILIWYTLKRPNYTDKLWRG